MGIKALDLSNYSGQLSPELIAGLIMDGYDLVLLQAVDPSAPGAPPGEFLEQVAAIEAARLAWQPYVYVYPSDDTWMDRCLALLDRAALKGWLPHAIRVLDQDVAAWLDVEDQSAATPFMTSAELTSAIAHGLYQLDNWLTSHALPTAGLYTSRWWWERRLPEVTLFRTRPLWDAHYDGDGDAQHNFIPYGGWTAAAIKQFAGTSTIDGILNVDQDVFAEGARIMTIENPTTDSASPPPVPDEYVQKGWVDWYTVAVNERGIADALGQQVAQLQAQLAAATASAPQSQEEQAAFTALVGAVEKRFAADLAPLLQRLQALLGGGAGG